MPKSLDVRIPQGLLEDLLPLAQERDLPIERYIIERLMLVAQLDRERNSFWKETICDEAKRQHRESPVEAITEAEVMGFLQDRVQSGHITGEEYSAIPPATVVYCIKRWLRAHRKQLRKG